MRRFKVNTLYPRSTDGWGVCCRHLNKVADELSNIAIDTGGWEGIKGPQV